MQVIGIRSAPSPIPAQRDNYVCRDAPLGRLYGHLTTVVETEVFPRLYKHSVTIRVETPRWGVFVKESL